MTGMKLKMHGMLQACVLSLTLGAWTLPAWGSWESLVLPPGFSWESNVPDAAARARREDKPLIVYYTRTNCPPCDVLRARLRSNETLRETFKQHYIFTVVWGNSMNRTERDEYRQRYDVRGAPSWVLFHPQGGYVCTLHGGVWPQEDGAEVHELLQTRLKSFDTEAAAAPTARPCRSQ